jgi:type II secretory pathway component GspD/PulD (secretin)
MRLRRSSVTFFIAVSLLSSTLLYAQDAKEEKMNELLEKAAPEVKEAKISLDLKGIDVNELFKMLSEKSGMTIITTPEVKGRVSVFMDNLSFDEALDVVVTMQELAYEKKANVVKVMTKAEYEKAFGKNFDERKETRTIRLTYAKPSNVLAVINSLKSDLGKIIADESTGTIIITDAPPSLKLIEETIKELDRPLESAVFDINYARFADLKGYLNDLITPGVGQLIVDERSAKVIVTDLPQRLVRIKKLMEEFDEQSRQVLITGEIVEVDIDDQFQSGISWETIFTQAGKQKLDLVGNFTGALKLR